MPGCKTRNAVFILRQLERRDIWQKKEEFVLFICRFRERFSSSTNKCCVVNFEETKCRTVVDYNCSVDD